MTLVFRKDALVDQNYYSDTIISFPKKSKVERNISHIDVSIFPFIWHNISYESHILMHEKL